MLISGETPLSAVCGSNHSTVYLLKGNVGAATTVKEWIDFQDQKKYDGFPYATWKVGEAVSIKIQPPVTL